MNTGIQFGVHGESWLPNKKREFESHNQAKKRVVYDGATCRRGCGCSRRQHLRTLSGLRNAWSGVLLQTWWWSTPPIITPCKSKSKQKKRVKKFHTCIFVALISRSQIGLGTTKPWHRHRMPPPKMQKNSEVQITRWRATTRSLMCDNPLAALRAARWARRYTKN